MLLRQQQASLSASFLEARLLSQPLQILNSCPCSSDLSLHTLRMRVSRISSVLLCSSWLSNQRSYLASWLAEVRTAQGISSRGFRATLTPQKQRGVLGACCELPVRRRACLGVWVKFRPLVRCHGACSPSLRFNFYLGVCAACGLPVAVVCLKPVLC